MHPHCGKALRLATHRQTRLRCRMLQCHVVRRLGIHLLPLLLLLRLLPPPGLCGKPPHCAVEAGSMWVTNMLLVGRHDGLLRTQLLRGRTAHAWAVSVSEPVRVPRTGW